MHLPINRSTPPKSRSSVRLLLGSLYFTGLRYLTWLKPGKKYAGTKNQADPLPFLATAHQTPLIRDLRNVDMWLQHNKVKNLRLAVERINGIVLQPGETFSFWRTVGRPTRRKGYVEGMVLSNGSFYPGIGGGLCQLSNLIYWLTLHTQLTVTERWRHNYDVFPDADRTQPFASGATVSYNYIDLQIRNDTEAAWQLTVRVGVTHLQGEWRSDQPCRFHYQVYEDSHQISHEWWGGYVRHNTIRRKVFDINNNEIADEPVATNEAIMMYEPLLPEA